MLENFVFPQLEEIQLRTFLEHDGAAPYWGTIVRVLWISITQDDLLDEMSWLLDHPDHLK